MLFITKVINSNKDTTAITHTASYKIGVSLLHTFNIKTRETLKQRTTYNFIHFISNKHPVVGEICEEILKSISEAQS